MVRQEPLLQRPARRVHPVPIKKPKHKVCVLRALQAHMLLQIHKRHAFNALLEAMQPEVLQCVLPVLQEAMHQQVEIQHAHFVKRVSTLNVLELIRAWLVKLTAILNQVVELPVLSVQEELSLLLKDQHPALFVKYFHPNPLL
jgi:hypothetical protein